MPSPLWTPTPELINTCHLTHYLHFLNNKYNITLANYHELHQWSIQHPDLFWASFADFAPLSFTTPAATTYEPGSHFWNGRWFPEASFNFTEQLLARSDNHPALTCYTEHGHSVTITYAELNQKVASLSAYLLSLDVESGDRIAGYLPNLPETVICMLAAARLGAIWTTCSCDYGTKGVVERFEQTAPRILFSTTGYFYNHKWQDTSDTVTTLQQQLPSVEHTIIIPYPQQPEQNPLPNTIDFASTLTRSDTPNSYTPFPFQHPLYILYSSGTTGQPKCMVHSSGGTLIQHQKELMLQTDVHEDDTLFFFTTCAWMMWHWMISGLSLGCTLVLYDGSPTNSSRKRLISLIESARISIAGMGAKLIEILSKTHKKLYETHDLSRLTTLLTTGSPLLPPSFDYVYTHIQPSVRLCSISGGSDIISCFCLGSPLLPVYRGELQCAGLGMDMAIYNDNNQAVINEQGELVCRQPFPSMPLYFWNDKNNTLYQDTYFSTDPSRWTHGDYALETPHHGFIIYGRSDATLNPGGIRIGTAEIYHQLDGLPEIEDMLAISQSWKGGERIILFVVLKDNLTLTPTLKNHIKETLKKNASPHHVPAHIIQAPDVPRTQTGKMMELVVKKIIHQQPVTNLSAVANPECLTFYKTVNLTNGHTSS